MGYLKTPWREAPGKENQILRLWKRRKKGRSVQLRSGSLKTREGDKSPLLEKRKLVASGTSGIQDSCTIGKAVIAVCWAQSVFSK
jgi:hypothetical protein